MEHPIDHRFLDSDTGAMFERCLVCDKEVIESGDDYFIERIFRRSSSALDNPEILFEYAMCQDCAVNLRKDLSKESIDRIEAFFTSQISGMHMKSLHEATDSCLLTGKSIASSQEFSFHAHCKGRLLLHSIFPYAISDEGMEAVSELLSKETLDQLDDFKGKYFSGPPELADLLNPKRLIPL